MNRDDLHIFYPDQAYNIPKESLVEAIDADGTSYYLTSINVEAENIGSDYDVAAGTFISWDNFNPYVVEIRNEQKGSGGEDEEDNATYIERSENAITVRNLINSRSAKAVLLERFKDQKKLVVSHA